MIKLISKYRPLVKNETRYTIVSGGRGSGKSYSVATYLLMLSFENNRTILYIRYIMKDIRLSIYPEFLNKIEELNLKHIFDVKHNEIVNLETGSKIIFKGIKTGSKLQTANLKSITNVDTLVVDEAEEIPTEDIFDKMDYTVRTLDHFNKIIILFNPTTKASWIYERFYERNGVSDVFNGVMGDITYIHTTYLDVMDKLNQSLIDKFREIEKENPSKYNHIIMGGFLDVAEGVIFRNWKIGEFADIDFGYGMDFGFSNDPSTLTKVGIDRKKKRIYLDEVLYKTGMTTTELFISIRQEVDKYLVIADNAEPRLIEELRRKGLNIRPCVKGAGSILEGIMLIQDYELIITKRSINLIKELNNYIWSDRKSGTAIDLYNHAIDGARYYISHRLKKPLITRYNIR